MLVISENQLISEFLVKMHAQEHAPSDLVVVYIVVL